MLNTLFRAVNFVLFACLLGLGRARAAIPEKAPGRALFEANGCHACHRIGASGGPSGPDLTMVGFRRSKEWLDLWLKDPRAWKKGATMPDPRLPPRHRKTLVEYLFSLKGEAFSDGRPWNEPEVKKDPVQAGAVLFNRAGCAACHGAKGVGGNPNNNVAGGKIPALDGAWETFTLPELREKIRRGAKPAKADPKGPEPMTAMPAWGQVLSDEEIDAVAAYLLSLKPAGAPPPDW